MSILFCRICFLIKLVSLIALYSECIFQILSAAPICLIPVGDQSVLGNFGEIVPVIMSWHYDMAPILVLENEDK